MKSSFLGLFLLTAATASAYVIQVPEPAAIAELSVCAAGVGLIVWRMRRK